MSNCQCHWCHGCIGKDNECKMGCRHCSQPTKVVDDTDVTHKLTLSCGCPKQDEYSRCINQVHIKQSISKDAWEKEAQAWMNKLNIVELQILNNIIFHKRQQLITEFEGILEDIPEAGHRVSLEGKIDSLVYVSEIKQALEKLHRK